MKYCITVSCSISGCIRIVLTSLKSVYTAKGRSEQHEKNKINATVFLDLRENLDNCCPIMHDGSGLSTKWGTLTSTVGSCF